MRQLPSPDDPRRDDMTTKHDDHGRGPNLFRMEVFEARRNDSLGSATCAPRLSHWLVTSLAVAISVGVLSFLFFGHYTRRERVDGELIPVSGLFNVVAPFNGTIAGVRVRDGQAVKAGDVLLEVTAENYSATLGDTHAFVLEQLRARKAQLSDDLELQQRSAGRRAESLRSKIALLDLQLTQIGEQARLADDEVASNQKLFDRISPLGKSGYVSLVQLQQQEMALLSAKSQYKELVRRQLESRQESDAAKQELAQLPLDVQRQGNDVAREQAVVNQSIAENEMGHSVLMRAPRDGTVTTLLPRAGQTVVAGQPLLSILPTEARLEAQLLVPSRSIGFVEPGSRVVLRYQAFPYQKFGQQYGLVSRVSSSALSPSEVASLSGKQSSDPLYRVQVSLDRQSISAYGAQKPLRPGMAIDADIMMDRRRLIEWIFEPLYGLDQHVSAKVEATP
ncbi:MAG TPA: HlyD family efflux transporter periplasmic adaptor subunit [Xanthomonadaceae bacterium]